MSKKKNIEESIQRAAENATTLQRVPRFFKAGNPAQEQLS